MLETWLQQTFPAKLGALLSILKFGRVALTEVRSKKQCFYRGKLEGRTYTIRIPIMDVTEQVEVSSGPPN